MEFKRIVTNVAIVHVTIVHEDEQIKAHKNRDRDHIQLTSSTIEIY